MSNFNTFTGISAEDAVKLPSVEFYTKQIESLRKKIKEVEGSISQLGYVYNLLLTTYVNFDYKKDFPYEDSKEFHALEKELDQLQSQLVVSIIEKATKEALDSPKLLPDYSNSFILEKKLPFYLEEKQPFNLKPKKINESTTSEENAASFESKSNFSFKDLIDLAKSILNVFDDSPFLRMLTLVLTIKLLFFFDVNLIDNSSQTTVNPTSLVNPTSFVERVVSPTVEKPDTTNVYNFIFLTLEDFNNKRENNYDFGENIPFVFHENHSLSYRKKLEREVNDSQSSDGNISCIRQALESLSNGTEVEYIYIDHLGHAYLYTIGKEIVGTSEDSIVEEIEDSIQITGTGFVCLAKRK